MKRKSLVLITVLILAVAFSACLPTSGPTIEEHSLMEHDLEEVDLSVREVEIKFSEAVLEADANLKEAGEDLAIDLESEGELVKLNLPALLPDTDYQLLLTVKDESGEELREEIEFSTIYHDTAVEKENQTLMQTFYWDMAVEDYAKNYPEEKDLWQLLEKRAEEFAEVGITDLWLPPANKAWDGQEDVGYATYDVWDLGEFDQKGTVRTKYGTKEELDAAIAELDNYEVDVHYDAILNHRMGGDERETVPLRSDNTIESYTKFDLEGRQKYYSRADEWKWDWRAFNATDYDVGRDRSGSFVFEGKELADTYDQDLLMGLNIDYRNEDVVHEKKEWGKWLVDDIGFSGFRLDAIKHIHTPFIQDWIEYVQENTEEDVLFFGEAWYGDLMGLRFFLDGVDIPELMLFDFPLRTTFSNLRDGRANMANLGEVGLVNSYGVKDNAVTFTDNHDTGRDVARYASPIFRRQYQAYSYILTREHGLPTIFWKDYYQHELKEGLDRLVQARKYFAYGPGREVDNNDEDVYSYVREGLDNVDGTGLVMMITTGDDGEVETKNINSGQANTTYYDLSGNIREHVTTDENGYGDFKVRHDKVEGWSVWVELP